MKTEFDSNDLIITSTMKLELINIILYKNTKLSAFKKKLTTRQ